MLLFIVWNAGTYSPLSFIIKLTNLKVKYFLTSIQKPTIFVKYHVEKGLRMFANVCECL